MESMTTVVNEDIGLIANTIDETDMDDKIPKLDKMAVYCVDQISEEDVKRAKNEKLGIFLAYSKKKEDKPSQIKF